MELTADFFHQTSKVFTVGELTRQIRSTLETKFRAVWVQGEISNYKLHPSGHQYFTLKDQRAQIACVIWRDTMASPRQPIVDGSQVQVYGTVTVFEARGQYQLNVQILQLRGVGLLQLKFEALNRELGQSTEAFAPLDLIVVTRGGGSIEDLWEFNEEIVARAIFNSGVPVVSAVGHEIDFTICDFVADLRAPTPSAAAELIVPDIF